jgi:hypothetical protein
MNLDEYQIEGEKDVCIDQSKIDLVSINIPLLSSKWLRYLNKEKIKLKKYTQERDTIRRDRYSYYAGYGESYFKYALQKTEIKEYLNADEDLQEIEMILELQQVIVDYLKDVISILNVSGYKIKNFIDWRKFQAGGY